MKTAYLTRAMGVIVTADEALTPRTMRLAARSSRLTRRLRTAGLMMIGLSSVVIACSRAAAEDCSTCQQYCRSVLSDCLSTGTANSDCEQRYRDCLDGCSSRCSQSQLDLKSQEQVRNHASLSTAAGEVDEAFLVTNSN
jgi:hypothetical protein